MNPFHIFLSSTFVDLQLERQAVEQTLRRMQLDLTAMEYFGSRDETPHAVSLAQVDRAQVYVGIIAHRYGSGITEAEYRRARARAIPCLIYLKDDQASVPVDFVERDSGQVRKLEQFKNELKRDHVVSFFKSPDELAARIAADLHRLVVDNTLPAPKISAPIHASTQHTFRSRLFCAECGAFIFNCAHARTALAMPVEPGKPYWRAELPGSPANQIAFATIENRRAVIVAWRVPRRGEMVAPDGGIVALDLEEGKPIWSESVGVAIEGGVAITESLVVAGYGARGNSPKGAGGVIALDLKTGKERWRVPVPGGVRGAPAMDWARIYLAASNGELYCLDATTQEILWHTPAYSQPVPIPASPVIVRDHGKTIGILVATYGGNFERAAGKVTLFDEHGERMWGPHDAGGNVRGAPVIANGIAYIPAYSNYPSTGLLHAFHARTGEAVWKTPFTIAARAGDNRSHYFSAAPLAQNDLLYLGSLDHHLYILDARTGEPRGAVQVNHGIATPPVAVAGLIVFGENDGTLAAFDPVENKIVWQHSLGSPLLTAPLVADDVVIAACENGMVVAVPAHHGDYAWAAERVARANLAQAGEYRALAARFLAQPEEQLRACEHAARDWHAVGKDELAAQMWLAFHHPDRAARAFQLAGDACRLRDPRCAAQFYQRAAELYRRARAEKELNECVRLMTACAGLAHIHLVPRTTAFVQFAESRFTLRLQNVGKAATVGSIVLRLGGQVETGAGEYPQILAPGKEDEIYFGLRPIELVTRVEIEIEYRADAWSEPIRDLFVIQVTAVKAEVAPNITIDNVATLNIETGASNLRMTTNDVGMIRAQGDIHSVAVNGDVGAMIRRTRAGE